MKRFFPWRRFVVLLCLVLILGVLLSGCKSREAAEADRLFEQLDVEAPDGELIAKAQDAYAALSPEQRDTLEYYEQFARAEAKYRASEVDSLISVIGTVSIESGAAIEAARRAYEALDDEARALVTLSDELTAAENSYRVLSVEKTAAEIDRLINAIGEVTTEKNQAVSDARSAYDSADEEVQSMVKGLAVLEKAEELIHRLEVERTAGEIDAFIEAIGEVTLESGESIKAARAAYDLADEETKASVGLLDVLTEAEERFLFLGRKAQAEEMDALIATLGKITAESEEAVKEVREQFDKLPEEVRELVGSAGVLEKAEYTLQGIKDKAAAAEIKKLFDTKKYDEAIAFSEEYIGDRKAADLQGNLAKNSIKAYVAKANALMKKSNYEEAEFLLKTCKERFDGVSITDVTKALNTLKKAITEPANGKVFSSRAKGGYCTLKIKAGETPVFVKVVSNKDPTSFVTIYVRANKSATVHIRNGIYTIRYATGSKWYGTKDFFGSNTQFYTADTALEMTTTRSDNHIHYKTFTVTLYDVPGGNLTTSSISADEF